MNGNRVFQRSEWRGQKGRTKNATTEDRRLPVRRLPWPPCRLRAGEKFELVIVGTFWMVETLSPSKTTLGRNGSAHFRKIIRGVLSTNYYLHDHYVDQIWTVNGRHRRRTILCSSSCTSSALLPFERELTHLEIRAGEGSHCYRIPGSGIAPFLNVIRRTCKISDSLSVLTQTSTDIHQCNSGEDDHALPSKKPRRR